MQTKNPQGQTAGFDIVSQGTERLQAHDTELNNSFNSKRCGSKTPAFAGCIHPDASLYHIYCGIGSLERAEEYYCYFDNKPIAVIALRWGRSPYEFNWPVANKVCYVVALGECEVIPYYLGHALTICGAQKVYGIIGGEIVVWHKEVMQKIAA